MRSAARPGISKPAAIADCGILADVAKRTRGWRGGALAEWVFWNVNAVLETMRNLPYCID